MTNDNSNLSFRETISLLGFGYKLANRLTSSYIPCMLLRSLAIAAQPLMVLFFSARILNELSGARNLQLIVTYAAATVLLSFIFSAARALFHLEIETKAGWERIFNRIQMLQAERYTQMDYAYTEDSTISETLARMDTQAMGNGLGLLNIYNLTPTIAENVFTLLFSLALLTGLSAGGGLSGLQAAAIIAFFIIGMTVAIKYRGKMNTALERLYKENAKANTAAMFFQEYIKSDQAAKDVRIYNQGNALAKIFRDSFNSNTWLSFFFLFGRIDGFTFAILAATGGALYLAVGLNALGGTATIGGIVQTVGAAMALASAIGHMAAVCGQLYNNGSFLKPMREFLTLPDTLKKGTKPVPPAGKLGYQFEFKNVSFKYPGAENYALEKINLHFDAGKRMAVVGPNGSGKTTMIKLLCRLYDPTEGEILLEGVNIKEYDYDQYIALFSVVFQDYMLFPLMLGQNVAVGDLRAKEDEDRVMACLKGAGFSERLETMPDGLNTTLYKSYDENGTQISGGEAQKIALARALYRDAPMVILDEPTAALDPIAEYDVYTTFEETIGGKTAVFISHRLSSCRFCHDIAVFDKGRLVQRGSHEKLLENENGLYSELWNTQAQHYLAEN